ncbi:ferrous iron transport protein A [Thermococcus sp. M36]|uniref:FeoA family protein n=1 Tax=Thermococcus sp. M36 TaxID=1638261 RepID=UPI001439492C|nr:FeoA domain-containing protein [Thermococcus sp. M36]NJE06051.1 ferrous iron transport protein A [Thermococcus sp. M36]
MTVPLSSLRPGDRGVVVNILGGPRARQRLVGMGLTPGVIIQILEAHSHGPIIISAGGVKFAIGRGMADKVIVRKL